MLVRPRLVGALAISVLSLNLLYTLLFFCPWLIFDHAVRVDNLVLHARAALPPAAKRVAGEALRRIQTSPLYVEADTYDVYLCDTSSVFAVFALWDQDLAGVTHYLTGNTFLRPGLVERNRLIGVEGFEVPAERTLTYFIAHEVTHVMGTRRLGRIAHQRLARWQQEGYADYVGKAGAFDYPAVLQKFRRGDVSLDPDASGLYLRYHLLVAQLLDHEQMSVAWLLAEPRGAEPVEQRLRGFPLAAAPPLLGTGGGHGESSRHHKVASELRVLRVRLIH